MFFGTGETFLFRVEPDFSQLTVYNATLENYWFLMCDTEGIGIGSDPHFGLYVDKELTQGSSHRCKTFSNDPLSDRSHFVIKKIELWGFLQPY